MDDYLYLKSLYNYNQGSYIQAYLDITKISITNEDVMTNITSRSYY